jgi:hypothetical protein
MNTFHSHIRFMFVMLALLLVATSAPSPLRASNLFPSAISSLPPYKTDSNSVVNSQFATFVVHWDHQWCPNSTDMPQETKDALLYALNIAGAKIGSSVPINVGTCWVPQCPLGQAGVNMQGLHPNTPPVDYWYPVSLADALSGQELYDFGDRGDCSVFQ